MPRKGKNRGQGAANAPPPGFTPGADAFPALGAAPAPAPAPAAPAPSWGSGAAPSAAPAPGTSASVSGSAGSAGQGPVTATGGAWGGGAPAHAVVVPPGAHATPTSSGSAASGGRPAPAVKAGPPPPPYSVGGTKKGAMPVSVEKRAKGKVVTVIANLGGDLKTLCTELKHALGTGGLLRDDQVRGTRCPAWCSCLP